MEITDFTNEDFHGRELLNISLATNLQTADTHILTLSLAYPSDELPDRAMARHAIAFNNVRQIRLNYADQGKPATIRRIHMLTSAAQLLPYREKPFFPLLKHVIIEIESYDYSFIDVICEGISLEPAAAEAAE